MSIPASAFGKGAPDASTTCTCNNATGGNVTSRTESAVTVTPSLLEEAAETPGAPAASRYSCPTHAAVTAKEAGRCPICGAALVAPAATERKP